MGYSKRTCLPAENKVNFYSSFAHKKKNQNVDN